MIDTQNAKYVLILPPSKITNGAYFLDGTTNKVDTLGFDHLTALFMVGATDAVFNRLRVLGCDTADEVPVYLSETPHYYSYGFAGSPSFPTADADNQIYGFSLSLVGMKRFLAFQVRAASGTIGESVAGLGILSRGRDVPSDLASRGLAALITN